MPSTGRHAPIEALIFDLDGTLLDSSAQIATALNVAITSKGLARFSASEAAHHIGWGSIRLIETTFAARGMTLSSAEVAAMEKVYLDAYAVIARGEPTFFPGAIDLLKALDARGRLIGLSTNKPEAITRTILAAAGIASLFRAVIGGDSGFGLKPSPDPVSAARRQLGSPVQRTIFVGDSSIDAAAAFGAELPFALIRHPGHPEPKMTLKPQWTLSHLSAILPIVDERGELRRHA